MPETVFHIGLSVSGALSLSPEDFAQKFQGAFVDKNTRRIIPLVELHRLLEEAAAAGHKYIPSEGCNHFDPASGCLGHPLEDALE